MIRRRRRVPVGDHDQWRDAAGSQSVKVGEPSMISFTLKRRGENLVVLSVEGIPNELTLANNLASARISGVQDRLRVLLVTGEPHAGARVWRDLLKSDPAVDLVHFTILRPPQKSDNVPIEEIALIAFPKPQAVPREAGRVRPGDLRSRAAAVGSGGSSILIAWRGMWSAAARC
jgi:hypothetical protein